MISRINGGEDRLLKKKNGSMILCRKKNQILTLSCAPLKIADVYDNKIIFMSVLDVKENNISILSVKC